MEEPQQPSPLSIKFDPSTRERMKLICGGIGFSENHLVNLCVEGIFDMVWRGDAAGIPQVVKLLRVAMEEQIGRDQVQEARSRVFEIAENEGTPKLRKALQDYDRKVQAKKPSISYSRRPRRSPKPKPES
jgi:hypothetical protein